MLIEMDLKGLEAYLKERRSAWERQRPYMLGWVKRFLSGAGARLDLAPFDRKRVFEGTLRRDPCLEEWLVRQALDAVDLYLDQEELSFGCGFEAKCRFFHLEPGLQRALFLLPRGPGEEVRGGRIRRGKKGRGWPVVLSEEETRRVLAQAGDPGVDTQACLRIRA